MLVSGSFQGGKVENGETPEECLARELDEELSIVTRIGEKCAESSHEYEHGRFRVIAYLVDYIAGEPRTTVHDRLEWVKVDGRGIGPSLRFVADF